MRYNYLRDQRANNVLRTGGQDCEQMIVSPCSVFRKQLRNLLNDIPFALTSYGFFRVGRYDVGLVMEFGVW